MFYKLGLDFTGRALFREKFYFKTILSAPITSLPLSLAEWVSQCGTFSVSKKNLRLSTDQALKAEVELLQVLLQQNFNLFFTIHKAHIGKKSKKQNYRLFFNQKQTKLILSIIIPYLEPTTCSKLGICKF